MSMTVETHGRSFTGTAGEIAKLGGFLFALSLVPFLATMRIRPESVGWGGGVPQQLHRRQPQCEP